MLGNTTSCIMGKTPLNKLRKKPPESWRMKFLLCVWITFQPNYWMLDEKDECGKTTMRGNGKRECGGLKSEKGSYNSYISHIYTNYTKFLAWLFLCLSHVFIFGLLLHILYFVLSLYVITCVSHFIVGSIENTLPHSTCLPRKRQ